MKTMIAIPCMDQVPVPFMQSLLYLDKIGETSVAIESSSLIYDSRNSLLHKALDAGVDRVLWFDSDMEFAPDTMVRLSADLDAGYDIVSGLYIKRRKPFTPVIFKECYLREEAGLKIPSHKPYDDYPRDQIFEVAAFGFGCVMMSMSAVQHIVENLGGYPFMPAAGFGEDLSFCLRARQVGIKLWCDSRVQCGHVGYHTYSAAETRWNNE